MIWGVRPGSTPGVGRGCPAVLAPHLGIQLMAGSYRVFPNGQMAMAVPAMSSLLWERRVWAVCSPGEGGWAPIPRSWARRGEACPDCLFSLAEPTMMVVSPASSEAQVRSEQFLRLLDTY